MPLLASTADAVSSFVKKKSPGEQLAITVHPKTDESLTEICVRLARALHEKAATPLHLLVLGRADAEAAGREALRKAFVDRSWPTTWVEGAAVHDQPIAGIQAHAFSGEVERIECEGKILGSVFVDQGARQCLLGGLIPANPHLKPGEQTRHALEKLQAVLSLAGLELADTVRTWFFLENILSWYDEFNRARTASYSGIRFHTGSLPASTGVGAKNSARTALALAAWAFRPLEKSATAKEIGSPLQCAAPAYGSAFSRAMELSGGNRRRLLISGTASIAPGGETLWSGDARRQVALTMGVVEAILHARGFQWTDLTRAIAYFRRKTDATVFANWLAAHHLEQMPVVAAQCDVCRDDLLFELEADAERTA